MINHTVTAAEGAAASVPDLGSRLNPRALSSASLAALTRHCELKINRGTAGDEEYVAYVLCQLERGRRT